MQFAAVIDVLCLLVASICRYAVYSASPVGRLYRILEGSGAHRGCIFEHVCRCIAGLDVPRHVNSANAFGRASGMQRGSDAITSERHDVVPRLVSMSYLFLHVPSPDALF